MPQCAYPTYASFYSDLNKDEGDLSKHVEEIWFNGRTVGQVKNLKDAIKFIESTHKEYGAQNQCISAIELQRFRSDLNEQYIDIVTLELAKKKD